MKIFMPMNKKLQSTDYCYLLILMDVIFFLNFLDEIIDFDYWRKIQAGYLHYLPTSYFLHFFSSLTRILVCGVLRCFLFLFEYGVLFDWYLYLTIVRCGVVFSEKYR